MNTYLAAYEGLVWHLFGGLLFLLATTFLSKRLSHKPRHASPNTTYECGEEPIGGTSARFSLNYHITALVFLLFEVELLFLFPWAVASTQPPQNLFNLPQWGYWVSGEILVFLGVLGLGLWYIWKKGAMQTQSAVETRPKVVFAVPSHYYAQINKKYEKASGTKSQ